MYLVVSEPFKFQFGGNIIHNVCITVSTVTKLLKVMKIEMGILISSHFNHWLGAAEAIMKELRIDLEVATVMFQQVQLVTVEMITTAKGNCQLT